MGERELTGLRVFGIVSLLTSIANMFGLLGGLNSLCDSQSCSDSATRINWLNVYDLTSPNAWSEAFPTVGIPDIVAIMCSIAIIGYAFKDYISDLISVDVEEKIIQTDVEFSKSISSDSNQTDIDEEEDDSKTEEIISPNISFEDVNEKYTVKDLKEILRTNGIAVSGKKADLINRAIENGCFDPPETKTSIESEIVNTGELAKSEVVLNNNKSENTMMDVDSVIKSYDENTDGKIEHSEYVEKHKDEVESGGISAVIDRLLDDSPELRGQRLWVMFALSVLLVAAMNAYAMVREPELVLIEDLVEHNNEVVSIEGTVVSWVADPYSSGDNRVDIIIEDDTGVAELRWYRYGDIPMLGTKVKATGDVIEYEGRIWLQALGGGALSWDSDDVPEPKEIGISTIAANPQDYLGETFTITGYLSKSVNPDSTFTALYLGDHPEYGSSEHQMRMVIHSAPTKWLESGQKVEVTAVVQYEQRELRWSIHTQGPEVRIVRTHDPVPTTIGWSNYESWSFSANNMVKLVGEISEDNVISDDESLSVCLLNAGDVSDLEGQTKSIIGRLSWSDSKGKWCIDVGSNAVSGVSEILGAEDMLNQLASNPSISLDHYQNGTQFNITGEISGSTLMNNDEDTRVSIVNAAYPNTLSKFAAYIPLGMYSGWLEDGQGVEATVTLTWNSYNAELQLNVVSLVLVGDPPPPEPYDLSDGPPQFYDLNKLTSITGNLVTIDNLTYLQKEGGQQKIRIDVQSNSIYESNSQNQGKTLRWTGRLIEMPDFNTLSHYYVLDDADVTDLNGNGIADDAEDV